MYCIKLNKSEEKAEIEWEYRMEFLGYFGGKYWGLDKKRSLLIISIIINGEQILKAIKKRYKDSKIAADIMSPEPILHS